MCCCTPSYESLVHYLNTQNPEEARIALLEIGLRVSPQVINQMVSKMWLGEIPNNTPMLSEIIFHPKVKLGLAEVALSNKLDNLDQYENYVFDALSNDDSDVMAYAIIALGRIEDAKAFSLLQSYFTSVDRHVFPYAVTGLQRLAESSTEYREEY